LQSDIPATAVTLSIWLINHQKRSNSIKFYLSFQGIPSNLPSPLATNAFFMRYLSIVPSSYTDFNIFKNIKISAT